MSHTDTKSKPDDAVSTDEICSMAGRLIGRHGADALEIAGYYAEESRILGDDERAAGWRAVHSLVADILSCGRPQDRAMVH